MVLTKTMALQVQSLVERFEKSFENAIIFASDVRKTEIFIAALF